MDRVNRIINHALFKKHLEMLKDLERDRVFCKHDLQHMLDVSRLAWIHVLSDHLPFDKDIIYAIGLLHDIGRVEQYIDGFPHAQASVNMARIILPECGFETVEINIICNAIIHHHSDSEDTLQSIIFLADKASRLCSFCQAKSNCKWPEKNKYIIY